MRNRLVSVPPEARQVSGVFTMAGPAVPGDVAPPTPLVETLWLRRWTFAFTVVLCLAGAVAYLLLATRVYTSKSKLCVEQNGPRVLGDAAGAAGRSDNYLHTQAEVIRSRPILQPALDRIDYSRMKTFAGVTGDPVVWLWRRGDFRVDVGKKDDIIAVLMDSPYPQEAAAFVNAVVDSYVTYQSKQKRTTGAEMMKILQKEKADLEGELDARLKAMLQFKRDNDALSFRDDKGNIIVERLATLSGALTAAEIVTLELRTQRDLAGAVLKDPAAVAAFVQSEQMKQKDWGDREYDEIRNQLQQYLLALNGVSRVQGENGTSPRMLQANVELLRKRKADKERAMAEAHYADVSRQLAAAEAKEKQLRASFEVQQKQAMDLNAKAAEYARLEAELERARKQYDLIDSRIKEVNVNSEDAGRLNVQVLEPARAEERASKPKKTLVLATALLAGLLLGTGMCLLRDWADRRLHSAEETTSILGMPVIATVPRMPRRLSLSERGRKVEREPMSEPSEAYRTLRTAIHLGTTGDVRSILLTSPTPGDGKSTTASNLAIALAQAGHRTLLLDADLRKPVQHKIFDVDGSAGIADVLTGRRKLKEVVRPTAVRGLYVLPCGAVPPNPSEIIASKGFLQVLEALGKTFDRVVIDSPPVMAVADARILAAAADATVLVLRMNKSDRKLSALAIDALHGVGANVLGWVANGMRSGSERYYGGYGYYRADSDVPAQAKAPAASVVGPEAPGALRVPEPAPRRVRAVRSEDSIAAGPRSPRDSV
jgi:capsular exopolysaccharide synthesis family protein